MNGQAFRTVGQRMAAEAFACVNDSKSSEKSFDEYKTFAKKFPSLVHACGLAQAIAFAQAKDETQYLNHLARVVGKVEASISTLDLLAEQSRRTPLGEYLRLSRNVLTAAGWIKRYVEALAEEKN